MRSLRVGSRCITYRHGTKGRDLVDPRSRKLTVPVEYHAGMIENAVDEIPLGGEPCIIPVVDMIAANLITPLVSAFPPATSLIVTAARQQIVADLTILSYPHPDIWMGEISWGLRRRSIFHGASLLQYSIEMSELQLVGQHAFLSELTDDHER